MTERVDIELRPGRPADIAQVEKIEIASFSDPWPRSSLLAELQTDGLRAPLVAESNGRVVGYLMAWRVVDQLHILNLAVATDERRRGAGSRLLRASLSEAAACGMKTATLEVRRGNAGARQFYLRHGFTSVGERRRYYADTGEDAVIMTRSLRSRQL